MDAHVVNIKNAAGPPGVGMIQPILLRWQSRACPLTVFALPAVQAVLMYKWEAWAARFLQYEFILYLCWLVSYTVFIILFQVPLSSPTSPCKEIAVVDRMRTWA